MNHKNRINYLDTLKAFIIVLVIIMHTALAYVGFKDWVHNLQSDNAFYVICFFAESGVLMPIMFFISGYFTLPSLLKHGPAEFLKSKLTRLGIPFIIGVFILSPILWLFSYYSDGGTLPWIQAVSQWFSRGYLGQFHFWYLGMLLLYFILVVIVYKRFPGVLKASPDQSRQPSALFFVKLIAIATAFCFLANLGSQYTDWTILGLLQFQPVKLPLYNIYFVLGIYAWRMGWLTEGYRPRLFPWVGIYLVSFLSMVGLVSTMGTNPATILGKLVLNFAACVEMLSALMTCLALFQKLQGRDRPVLQAISSLSYSAYIVHLNIVFAILYLSRDIALPLFPKYILQAVLALSISWGAAYLLKHSSKVTSLLHRRSPQTLSQKLQL
jgi:glucan biosynthesis protein C